MPKKPKRLRFAKPDPKGIPLKEVMAVHRQFQPLGSLPDNVGDGFLCATNPVYRSIRKEFLKRGFRYSLKDQPDYYAFPLMSLDDAIARGVVPYRKNFPWLEILEKKAPGKFTLTAMANTVECVAAIFAEGEIGGYFLDANCHFRTNEQESAALIKLVQKIGLRRLAKAVMASFLYANYMYERLDAKEKNLIAELVEVKASVIAPAIRVGFELSEIFRTNTTHLHLLKMGFPADLQILIQFDPVKKLLGDKKLGVKFNELAEIIVHELKISNQSTIK
jgi:hypothetical protein